MSDELSNEPMTDAEFQSAVAELSEEKPGTPEPGAERPAPKGSGKLRAERPAPKGSGKLRAELAKLEARRAELKKMKPEELEKQKDGFVGVKAAIAKIKAELGE